MKKEILKTKRVAQIALVTKRILNVFKKLSNLEKQGNIDNDIFNKNVENLAELILHEQSLCEKLCQVEECQDLIYQIMGSPEQFQNQYNIKGRSFSRFFRNLFIYNQEQEAKLDINILDIIPDFSHLQFQITNNNYPQLFKAFSEDLFYTYIKLVDKSIQENDNQIIKEELIEEKYKIFSVYANTNEFFIKTIQRPEEELESKAAIVLEENGIDERVYDFLLTDFAYNFCVEFFETMLSVEDKDFKPKDKIIRFTLLEAVLGFTNSATRDSLENLFYRKYYELDHKYNLQNQKVSENIVQIFQNYRKKSKILTI